MGQELVPVGPVFEGEALETSVETAFFENYIDVLPAESDELSTPLDEADEVALADGIASIFDAMLAEAGNDDEESGASRHDVPSSEPTMALLAELNRLWAEPLAA